MQYTHKKSLGQHFLHDEVLCRRIVDSLGIDVRHLLEIGPGAGAITKYLIEKSFSDFRCVELDQEKIDYLYHQYPVLNGSLIHADFLKMAKPFVEPFSVIGNFPYNISSQIVFRLLDWREDIIEVVGMFQKEVAVRIASAHGTKDYGILSVLAQCFFDIEYLFDVPPESFTPPPKVMSGVIRLRNAQNPYRIEDYDRFRKFVKIAFSQRRKTLRNCFKSYLPTDVLQDEVFNKRAEQLSVSQFVELFKRLQTQKAF